jgi:hypothetical protein
VRGGGNGTTREGVAAAVRVGAAAAVRAREVVAARAEAAVAGRRRPEGCQRGGRWRGLGAGPVGGCWTHVWPTAAGHY